MRTRAAFVPVVLCSVFLAGACSGAPADDPIGDALLAEIMDSPGRWSQMCLSPRPVAFDVPVPLIYSHVAQRHFGLDSKALKRAAANRPAVVAALKGSLAGMDLSHPPASAQEKRPDGWERSGLKPEWFNAIHLELIKGLQAVEVLPEMLRLEDQLYQLIQAAEKNKAAPLPVLPLDSPVEIAEDSGKRRRWGSPEDVRRQRLFACRIFQREMLGVVVQLLRAEKWAPVIESTMEKENAKDASSIVPFTPDLRSEVRGWATDFLAKVPPEKWRGAAAMTTNNR